MNSTIPRCVGPYKVIYPIGNGAFSKVYQGINMNNKKKVALKFINRNILQNVYVLKGIEREMRISERISHKNIVRFYKVFFLSDYIVLTMECLGNGTLTAFKETSLFNYDTKDCLKWCKDILEGMNYLHQNNIAHHDIKPDNIGFDKFMNAKILDLGLCEEFKEFCYDKGGTPLFRAPEIEWCDKYDGIKADIWSFGVTMHYMVTGMLPFSNVNGNEIFRNVNHLKRHICNTCPEPFKTLVDLTLAIDPKKRPTAKDMLDLSIFKFADYKNPYEEDLCLIKEPKAKRRSMKNIIIAPLVPKRMKLTRQISEIRFSNILHY